MENTIEMYLCQIAMQRKIPFEMVLPNDRQTMLGSLSDSEFNLLMDQAYLQYVYKECTPIDDFEVELHKKFNC